MKLFKHNPTTRSSNSKIRLFDYSIIPPHSIISHGGFTLVEMLVVIGIIAVLIGAGIGSFTAITKRAQKAKGQELVSNVATALTAIYQKDGCWPRRILAKGRNDGEVDEDIAYDITAKGMMSLTTDPNNSSSHKTIGLDRFGIISPWAAAVVKRGGKGGVNEGTRVPSGGTIREHRLHFAIDDDGDGYVDASVGGETVRVRGSAAVWCSGMDGKIEQYSVGVRGDDIYSWSKQQIKK